MATSLLSYKIKLILSFYKISGSHTERKIKELKINVYNAKEMVYYINMVALMVAGCIVDYD